MALTKAQERYALEQGMASSIIEGHTPTPEFLADYQAILAGRITFEEAHARSEARALRANASNDTVAKPSVNTA